MAEHFVGYYYVREHGHLVVIRKMTLAKEHDELTTLSLAGQRDPVYVHLEDPEVGALIGERKEAAYLMGVTLSKATAFNEKIDLSGFKLPGTCSECGGPLKDYIEMLADGRYYCPHCGSILLTVCSSPFNDMACGLKLQGETLDKRVSVTPPFKLPFGFPIPPALNLAAEIGPKDLKRVTEYENLEDALGPYLDTLK